MGGRTERAKGAAMKVARSVPRLVGSRGPLASGGSAASSTAAAGSAGVAGSAAAAAIAPLSASDYFCCPLWVWDSARPAGKRLQEVVAELSVALFWKPASAVDTGAAGHPFPLTSDVDAEFLPLYRGQSSVDYPFAPDGLSSVAKGRVAFLVRSRVPGKDGECSVCLVAADVAKAERCVAAVKLRLQTWRDLSTLPAPPGAAGKLGLAPPQRDHTGLSRLVSQLAPALTSVVAEVGGGIKAAGHAIDEAGLVRLGESLPLAGPVIALAACIARTCVRYAANKEAALEVLQGAHELSFRVLVYLQRNVRLISQRQLVLDDFVKALSDLESFVAGVLLRSRSRRRRSAAALGAGGSTSWQAELDGIRRQFRDAIVDAIDAKEDLQLGRETSLWRRPWPLMCQDLSPHTSAATLAELDKQLLGPGAQGTVGRVVLLSGLPGVGKTHAAQQFALRHEDDYSGGLVMLNADNPSEASHSLDHARLPSWVKTSAELQEFTRRNVAQHG